MRSRSSSAERRREQEEILNPDNGNVRPVEAVTPIKEANRCSGAKYGEHDFSMITRGPQGSGFKVARCWYCSEMSPFCKQRVEDWQAAQKQAPTGDPRRV